MANGGAMIGENAEAFTAEALRTRREMAVKGGETCWTGAII
jgi:hypothetical protein